MSDTVATSAQHDILVNGINLHYCTWGEFSTPDKTVLLIHGLTASSQSWADYGPYLAERGWFAIAPDIRGRGLSDKPTHGYGIQFHANDAFSLCDALGLEQIKVVGHSLGATIAMHMAIVHPERISKLVMIDAGGVPPADIMQSIGPSLARLGQIYPSLEAYLGFMSQLPVWEWNPFWENYVRYDAEVLPEGTARSRVSKEAIMEELASNATVNLQILPAFIKVPTQIVMADSGILGPDAGRVLTPAEAERLKNSIAGSQLLVIPERNHYTLALSDVFREGVTTFLAE
jgi:pimeloyl-ACP methyl ester carboxylesterase